MKRVKVKTRKYCIYSVEYEDRDSEDLNAQECDEAITVNLGVK